MSLGRAVVDDLSSRTVPRTAWLAGAALLHGAASPVTRRAFTRAHMLLPRAPPVCPCACTYEAQPRAAIYLPRTSRSTQARALLRAVQQLVTLGTRTLTPAPSPTATPNRNPNPIPNPNPVAYAQSANLDRNRSPTPTPTLTLTRWPMINLLTYCLAPLPLLAYWSIHGGDSLLGDSGGGAAQHWAYFTSSAGAAVVVGLPLVLYHNRVIEGGAALMDIAGFLLLCATVGLGVAFHREGDGDALFG